MIERVRLLAGEVYDRLPPTAQRFAKYAICGVAAVALDFAIYALLVAVGVFYQTANLLSTIAGLTLSFTLNRAFTFRVFDAPIRRLIAFFAVGAVGYGSSAATLHLLVEELHVGEALAKAPALAVAVAAQFTLNSLITFRQSKSTPGA